MLCIAHLPDLQALNSDTLAKLDFMCPSCHIVDTCDAHAHGQVMDMAPYIVHLCHPNLGVYVNRLHA